MPVIILAPSSADAVETRDFSRYDGFIDDLGILLDQGQDSSATNRTVNTRPPKQDTGQNKYETRPEVGDVFSQGNFSHGQGQEFFHDLEADPAKYLWGDGFNIESLRKLAHLRKAAVGGTVTASTSIEQVLDQVYVANGTDVLRTSDFSTYTTEDPSGAEAAATVLSLAAQGSKLFAAIGTGGVHVRSSAGVWTHYQPDAATDLALAGSTSATLVRTLRARLFVVGDGDSLYEVVATSAPAVLGDVLPEGWTYTDVFEGGEFIYALAVDAAAGLSRVYHFRLKEDASGFEPVGSSGVLPRGQLAYTGIEYLGKVFLAGGKRNASNGYDPVLYQCVIGDSGFLFLEQKIAEGEGSGALDLSVRALVPHDENLVFGWSQGSSHPYEIREGLGVFHLARGAFANFVQVSPAPATPKSPLDIAIFKGRMCWVTSSGVYAEDPSVLVATATLISSIGDWNSAGEKNWSEVEITHPALPAGTSIEVYYTTEHPSVGNWTLIGTNGTEGSLGKTFQLTDVTSVFLTIKIVSRANTAGTEAPELATFAVLSDPAPREPEWMLARTFTIAEKMQKDEDAEPIYYTDPNATISSLEDLIFKWVTLYEQPSTWRLHVEQVTVNRVGEPQYASTVGETSANVFTVEMVFRGKKLTSDSGEIRVV